MSKLQAKNLPRQMEDNTKVGWRPLGPSGSKKEGTWWSGWVLWINSRILYGTLQLKFHIQLFL